LIVRVGSGVEPVREFDEEDVLGGRVKDRPEIPIEVEVTVIDAVFARNER
jgi:hypothetical protein